MMKLLGFICGIIWCTNQKDSKLFSQDCLLHDTAFNDCFDLRGVNKFLKKSSRQKFCKLF